MRRRANTYDKDAKTENSTQPNFLGCVHTRIPDDGDGDGDYHQVTTDVKGQFDDVIFQPCHALYCWR